MNREQRRAFARENGVPMPPAEPEQPGLQVAPVPTTTNVGSIETPGGGLVTLQVVTPVGVQVYFLSPDHARQLGGHLAQFAMAAKSGLTIVGDAQVAPPEPEVGA